ncbi:MAG: hypothetical protein NZ738_06485 [Oceanospirillaceae bacterium]|nr:hypothetical protein [Oceanospirillaceae bacterium]
MRIGFGDGSVHGFALLEVLLALGLSSVMLLVLYSAQRHSQAVLVYSQQLHHANQLLSQVASQVWAYPQHYELLTSELNAGDAMCLARRQCTPAAMTQAWATYWHQHMLQQLPQADLTVACADTCIAGQGLTITLQWQQKLASASPGCPLEMACVALQLTL